MIATGAVAGTIVVRASGPSAKLYAPGKAITASTVTLKAGDTLVLLDSKGTRTLSGAGTHSVAGGSAAVAPSALGALIRSSGARQVRTGAVRGALTGPAKSPNLWYVDATRGGSMCIADPATTSIWRPDMTAAASYSISGGGKNAPLDFAAGQSVRPWPAQLPLIAGARYRLAPPTGAPVEIVIQPVGAVGTSADAIGAALIDKGCSRQLDQLVEAGQSTPTG
jgi:hypothetical protein